MNNTIKYDSYKLLILLFLLIQAIATEAYGQCNLKVTPGIITFSSVGQTYTVSVSGGCNYEVSTDRFFTVMQTIDGNELTIKYNSEVPSEPPSVYYIKLLDFSDRSIVLATITVNVSPMLLNGGSISTPNTTVVSGASPGTFTNSRSPMGGTGTYSYFWQRSTNGVAWTNISGATGITYACPILTSTTYFRRRVTSGSLTAYSNTLQIIVEDPPPPSPSFAPSAEQNYIVTKTMLNDEGTLSLNKVEYFDGLGRPAQTVRHRASPSQTDIVEIYEYDASGRPNINYLPTSVTTLTGAYVPVTTVKTRANTFYGDSRAFNETVYEPSPLNRIDKEIGPGALWHSSDKFVGTERFTNSSQGNFICAMYSVASDNSVKRNGIYQNGELYVTKITGEDEHVSYTFTDKLGRSVLERIMNGTEKNDTYYVYDDFGNLRYVLPPLATDALTANSTWNDDNNTLKNYAYIYKYDGRNRCIQKRLPGCEPIEMRYDKADRLIFSQDGNQRAANVWSFHFYDVFSRPTVSGIWGSPSIPEISGSVVTTKYDASGVKLGGYTVTNVTMPATVKLMTVNYYDNYNFTTGVTELNYITPPTGYDTQHSSAKGLLTGTRVYELNDYTKYTTAAFYYDHRGRIVQTRATNYMGGFDYEYFAYTFTGKVKQHQTVHNVPNKAVQAEAYTYSYDHAERLLSVTHKHNSSANVTLAQYSYDDIGRIKTKTVATETSDYTYNIRSWVEQINGTRFNQTLVYNKPLNGVTPTKELYGGNISAMKWKAGGETTERGYKFSYDGLDRLTDARYGEGTNITLNPDRFNEKLTYDKMGNIKTLQRQGKIASSNYNLIDNLTYTYNGNQLTKVTDAVTTPITNEATLHFIDGANVTNEYIYDANGNLIKDLNKNIASISYNYLNLPHVITFADGNSITYGYNGEGSKLSVVYNVGGNIVKNEYVGNKIYKNGTLSMILTAEGYITEVSSPKYHYYLKDHQGNNRVVIDQAGVVEQVNHYYPFGGLFGEGMQDSKQPYKYNGKELDRVNGLDVTDLGNRGVYHAINRFTTMDRFAEKFPWQSPYVHAGNNPIYFVEVNGDSINLAWIQRLDNVLGTNYTGKIIDDTQSQTGLTLSFGSNGVMKYDKDTNGNPIIATTTDATGNTVQSGSITARNIMLAAIDHQDMITVEPGRTSGVLPGTNKIGLNFQQIEGFINGTVIMDNRTLGWGMTLMHEINHTNVGGRLQDSPFNSGPVVTIMNTVRTELNAQGGNYGQRLEYYGTPIGSKAYIPFNNTSQFLINRGIIPIGANEKFIKF